MKVYDLWGYYIDKFTTEGIPLGLEGLRLTAEDLHLFDESTLRVTAWVLAGIETFGPLHNCVLETRCRHENEHDGHWSKIYRGWHEHNLPD